MRSTIGRSVPKAAWLLSLILTLLAGPTTNLTAQETEAASNTRVLRERLQASSEILGERREISPRSAESALELGWISSVAAGPDGLLYVLHRDLSQDPVVVLDRAGTELASWGRGLYVTPHSVRVDPAGNVWTVDSGSSRVLKFAPDGTEQLRIEVGLPKQSTGFGPQGATDVAFASDGHVFIADGYRNSRVLEYTPAGAYVGEWGAAGTDRGELRVVHSIAIDQDDIVYLADRENGRIQVFTRKGELIDIWNGLGKVYSVAVTGDSVWASAHPLDQRYGDFSGWLLQLDKGSGLVDAHLPVQETHSFSLAGPGSIVTSLESHVIQWSLRNGRDP
jgi:DNA-binding beta-propeller fold protein YncE